MLCCYILLYILISFLEEVFFTLKFVIPFRFYTISYRYSEYFWSLTIIRQLKRFYLTLFLRIILFHIILWNDLTVTDVIDAQKGNKFQTVITEVYWINKYVVRQHRKRNTICSRYFVAIRHGNETRYASTKFRN